MDSLTPCLLPLVWGLQLTLRETSSFETGPPLMRRVGAMSTPLHEWTTPLRMSLRGQLFADEEQDLWI